MQDTPAVKHPNPPYLHSLVFVPARLPGERSIGYRNGEKAIVIQDSWGTSNGTVNGKRLITERFYRERNRFAAYSMRFKFEEGDGPKPRYDGSIISLQKCLQYEGVFPINVAFVENIGPVTKKSIAQFQQKYGLAMTGLLDSPTVAKIKERYSS
ncbi:peptidoglycan-binding protein [Candidatus Parcubacteria bacterium]|nr:peptidoglycan-binding protein [Candidatus Parcubacteria bacterium]